MVVVVGEEVVVVTVVLLSLTVLGVGGLLDRASIIKYSTSILSVASLTCGLTGAMVVGTLLTYLVERYTLAYGET